MNDQPDPPASALSACDNPACGGSCPRAGVARRTFLSISAAGLGVLAAPDALRAVAAPRAPLSAAEAAALADRGEPTVYSGTALARIGMPVGGGCAGQVYLSGDGRMWGWDVANALSYPLGGADFAGTHYVAPLSADAPGATRFRQGFALRTGTTARYVDAKGFSDVRFTGQYPIGRVSYKSTASPVEVTLDAFSPFTPLETLDSTLPATVFAFTLRNTSAAAVDATLLGYSENPVCLDSRRSQPTTQRATAFGSGIEWSAVDPVASSRADILFEDWERDTYDGWTATGTAFGSGPVAAAAVPEYMKRFGDLNAHGTRFVTSHNYRANPNDIGGADAHLGTLTSPPFVVNRRYVTASIGGGASSATALQVVVDGNVVATASGADTEPMQTRVLDISAYQGRTAQVRLVDNASGAWAHLNVDRIVFSDRADIVFETWGSDTYGAWTTTGDAFGSGPVKPEQTPALMQRYGDLNVHGSRFVTSYNFRLSGDPDGRTGTLTSPPFEISRRYVAVAIGGGNRGTVNVVVDGNVVATATGTNSEPLVGQLLDVGNYEGKTARIQVVDNVTGSWAHINVGSITFTDRADILFEDWERTNYSGWTVTGTAFGAGPVTVAETPADFRRPFGNRTELNVSGSRFVTSYNFRDGSHDGSQGTLTSRVFTIDRRYITVWTGGGSNPATTAVNLLVDGAVVATATGADMEPLDAICWSVGRWAGKSAQIQIIDKSTGGWGHVNVDRIIFSDRPIRQQPVADRTDAGSFALATVEPGAVVRRSIAAWSTPSELFDAADGPAEVDGSDTQVGTVAVSVRLAPGESRTLRFVQSWFYPTPERRHFGHLTNGSTFRRHYATRFNSARQVTEHVGANLERLEAGTREWVRTWYDDSTLPHWFLERTFANTSTIATGTCHRWSDGRFYAWEGVYCCHGTCQHVWSYAQAIGRLFPDLERDTRERVDLGIAYKPTGEIANRGESSDAASSFADGHCGTILRIYREHQMAPDAAFLTRVWAKVKTSVEYVISARDGSDQDGIFRGGQWNTLDTEWFGEIPWLSGLYVAALRAASAMATEMGDTAAATRYTTIADRGSSYLNGSLWNGTYGYYVQKVDGAPAAANTNRGVFVDQMYGQTYAAQLGLPRVFAADKARTALTSLYRNNFQPNPAAYRPPGLPAGRVYTTANEPGTIMVAWPNGGSTEAGGHPYFNEVWTGQEWQFAAQLFAEGMTAEGLAVSRAIYDRHRGEKRNPYNEIEASDHYARAMMSFGTYLAACGYEYHGPRGHLGFAPRLTPEEFACAFTAAEGWGRYHQTRTATSQTATVDVRHGSLRLKTLAFETARPATAVTVTHAGTTLPATLAVAGNRAVVTLNSTVVISDQLLTIMLTT
ncbi:GH116 family glycosyl hydrolase [Kribbella sp. NPDC056345]|uniref:GH116 family glycosyl hydrolase n=1 Tax=Kribbella sp. NPDC056345 TaxID=3345789 RepID=UPI0035D5F46A